MSLYICSLNSGSNGNCYYIGNGQEAVLVDAGISCREIETRMSRLQLSIEKVKAVFVSHEHADHIKGLARFHQKHKVPVYISDATRKAARLKLDKQLTFSIKSHESISVGTLSVTPFPKQHDAADPYSFIVSHQQICTGVFTDIGTSCENVIHYFRQCHAAFLESNYDEEMLEKGNYPYVLKTRIRGGQGHLSNSQALELFTSHRPAFMSHLVLSHLSKNNNNPAIVQNLFDRHAGHVQMIVASRYAESALYQVGQSAAVKPSQTSTQLTLSF
jgi:phosphoribosyl 1,2-cyclic phosphodiesterase